MKCRSIRQNDVLVFPPERIEPIDVSSSLIGCYSITDGRPIHHRDVCRVSCCRNNNKKKEQMAHQRRRLMPRRRRQNNQKEWNNKLNSSSRRDIRVALLCAYTIRAWWPSLTQFWICAGLAGDKRSGITSRPDNICISCPGPIQHQYIIATRVRHSSSLARCCVSAGKDKKKKIISALHQAAFLEPVRYASLSTSNARRWGEETGEETRALDGCRRGKEKHNTRYRRLDLASLPLTGTASAHSSLSVSFVPVGQCRRLFAENLIIYTHTVWGAQQLTVEQDRKPFLLTIYCFLFFAAFYISFPAESASWILVVWPPWRCSSSPAARRRQVSHKIITFITL